MEGSTPLSNAELETYFSAINAAYPRKETNIKASVMAKIGAEANTSALARRLAAKRRQSFMKWGSLAACIVLVFTICINVIPSVIMNSADKDAAENYELAPADRARDEEVANSGADYAVHDMSEADAELNEEQAKNQAPFQTPEDASPEAEATDDASFAIESAPYEGYYDDRVKSLLIETVGAEEFAAWMTQCGYTGFSDWSIESFVQHFGTDESVLEEIKVTVLDEIEAMS